VKRTGDGRQQRGWTAPWTTHPLSRVGLPLSYSDFPVKSTGRGRDGKGHLTKAYEVIALNESLFTSIATAASDPCLLGLSELPYGITRCYLPPGRGDIPALWRADVEKCWSQGCRGLTWRFPCHGYGYGMRMGTVMNPHGPVGILLRFSNWCEIQTCLGPEMVDRPPFRGRGNFFSGGGALPVMRPLSKFSDSCLHSCCRTEEIKFSNKPITRKPIQNLRLFYKIKYKTLSIRRTYVYDISVANTAYTKWTHCYSP